VSGVDDDTIRALVNDERYRELKALYAGADFDYQGDTVLVFRLPFGTKVSADLDATLDALRKRRA
jgi:hypothetical protein